MAIINNLPAGGIETPDGYIPILLMSPSNVSNYSCMVMYKNGSSYYMGPSGTGTSLNVQSTRATLFYTLKTMTANFKDATSSISVTLKKDTIYRIYKGNGSGFYKVYLQEYDGTNYIDVAVSAQSTTDRWTSYILSNIVW